MKILISGEITGDIQNNLLQNAKELGLSVVINKGDANPGIFLIKEAIREATGYSYEEYGLENQAHRSRLKYFCRLIFANYCFENENLTVPEVSELLHGSKSNIQKYSGNFKREMKYNKAFLTMVVKTNDLLKKYVL